MGLCGRQAKHKFRSVEKKSRKKDCMDSSFIHARSVLEEATLGSVIIAIFSFALCCSCYLEIQVSAASLKSTWRNGDSFRKEGEGWDDNRHKGVSPS